MQGAPQRQAPMVNELKEMWSRASRNASQVGHPKKMEETRYCAGDSFNGIRVRILPSLSGTDACTTRKEGYR